MKCWRIAFVFCCVVTTHVHPMEDGAQPKRVAIVLREPSHSESSCDEGYYIFTTKDIQLYPSRMPTHKRKISVRQVDAICGLLRLTQLPPKNDGETC
jgi:hypothetical protein